ncbi:aromatic acid exporter family protein [Aerococcus urinaeequi]|uniref:aromatic acid exporter family protein n=1 Tax=Aerococcus urinaeequi TaxID=51665 RepID=UPI003AAF3A3F
MRVAIKSAKYAVATFIAIFLAQWLGLDYAVSAGVIAILSLAETSKKTVQYIGNLTLTMILSLLIATILFNLYGYEIWVFSLYLLITYPVSVYLKSDNAIAPCAVFISHLLLEQASDFNWWVNEMLLLVIGVGIAVIVNLYQTSASGEMDKLKGQIEREMQTILNHLADKMDTPDHPGHLLYEHIDQAYELAKYGEFLVLKEAENNITGDVQNYYLNYFSMRSSQLIILYDINNSLDNIYESTDQTYDLSGFFRHVSQQLSESNTAAKLRNELNQLKTRFRQQPLPQTRNEFETRSMLFDILLDCEKFLNLKYEFYKSGQRLKYLQSK